MADTSTHARGKKEDEAYIARMNWNAGNEARGGNSSGKLPVEKERRGNEAT